MGDLIRVIDRITKSSYRDFFRRYVSGTEVPPYDTIFGYAGYQLERATRKLPNLGVNLNERGQVIGVHDGAKTPLQSGDLILSVDGQTLEGQGGGTVFRLLTAKLGQNVRLRIRSGSEERELEITVGSVELVNYRIVDGKSPTPEQLKVRESWLKR
jgi:predicted metalloprotease with PDZ domain